MIRRDILLCNNRKYAAHSKEWGQKEGEYSQKSRFYILNSMKKKALDRGMIKLRKATIADLAILNYWDQQEHVKASDPNDDWNWEEELTRDPVWRQQLIAEFEEQAIGFIQIIDPHLEETQYWGSIGPNYRAIDIWIGEKENLNQGWGTEMMRQAIELCFQHPLVKAILIDPLESNTSAHRFYKRLGFEWLEKRTFGQDDCFIFQLRRERWFLIKADGY